LEHALSFSIRNCSIIQYTKDGAPTRQLLRNGLAQARSARATAIASFNATIAEKIVILDTELLKAEEELGIATQQLNMYVGLYGLGHVVQTGFKTHGGGYCSPGLVGLHDTFKLFAGFAQNARSMSARFISLSLIMLQRANSAAGCAFLHASSFLSSTLFAAAAAAFVFCLSSILCCFVINLNELIYPIINTRLLLPRAAIFFHFAFSVFRKPPARAQTLRNANQASFILFF